MTSSSRSSMGEQLPRQPQQMVLGATLALHRPLPHQHPASTPPLPKLPTGGNDEAIDAGLPRPLASHSRHAPSLRCGSSKLRLELSDDPTPTPEPLPDACQPLAPAPFRLVPVAKSISRPPPMSASTPVSLPASSEKCLPQDHDSPVPMPQRPLHPPNLLHPGPPISSPAPAQPRKDSRPKPYTVEVPPDAPRFNSTQRHDASSKDSFSRGLYSGHADFFPWTGHHHEDEWSAEAIQKGTWDKGSSHEISSARLAIFPALRQKSGLTTLSTIFMNVLNQRRYRGQVTAPWTFKPPPRVTLTDTKREVWLKDLANPSISLRRLSRTIPHGIRGRTLLDQCLNKNVPTERAIWLAKCVGANEIRAFKRKGASGAFAMGGESKWVRDWTIFVEQFVESIASAFEDSEWKAKASYALRLATHLYSEHLLDRDHYLDWIVSGLESSSQARIPMWILIAKITIMDIVRSRKHARRLVYALVNHLSNVYYDADRDILAPLHHQLSSAVMMLLKRNPESFVAPTLWPKYREVLKASLPAGDDACQNQYHRVNARNARLSVANTNSPPVGKQHLVRLLDLTLRARSDRELASKCLSIVEDRDELVKTLIEWATSAHRPGYAKTYVAARLLKAWKKLDINATPAILAMMDGVRADDGVRKKMMFHLVGELIRSNVFSVPQYLQWLIGRGGLHEAAEIDADSGPCATRLLVELPIHCLSESHQTQRQNLLRRAGHFSTVEEANDISNALKCVNDTAGLSQYLDSSHGRSKCLPLNKLLRKIDSSSRALQTWVGIHLRDVLTAGLLTKMDSHGLVAVFESVRAIFETIDDFSSFLPVLKLCSVSSNFELLAACTDTVNSHLNVFLAMGCAEKLFDALIDRLRSLGRQQGGAARPLLVALAGLARRLPQREVVAKHLVRELVYTYRSNAVDACSPVSDNMAMQAHSAESEVSDQLDKLLASGNTIDHPTMNRLFRAIVPKLEAGWAKADESRRVFASLLTRLRMLDFQYFDRLMTDWTGHIGTKQHRPRLADMFPLLVSLGAISMSIILQTASTWSPLLDETCLDSCPPIAERLVFVQELVQLVIMELPKSTCLNAHESYRFATQQKSARTENPKLLLLSIRNALIEYSTLRTRHPDCQQPLDDGWYWHQLVESLKYLVVADSHAVANVLNASSLPLSAASFLRQIVTSLLVPESNGQGQMSFREILDLTNELTMPFCLLKLNLDLSRAQQWTEDEGQSERQSRLEDFSKAMDRAIETRNTVWTSMLPYLSQDITRNISAQAHARFLDLIPCPKSMALHDEASSQERIHLAENLLRAIEAITSGQPPPKVAQLTGSLVEKLSDLSAIVACSDDGWAQAQQAVMDHWLPILLRFITIHSTSAEPTVPAATSMAQASAGRTSLSPSHEARARIILLLCTLLLDLNTRPQTTGGYLCQRVFDVALLLVDNLGDDVRNQCAKCILLMPGVMTNTSVSSDPRLYYLFSIPQLTLADNLRLAYREKSAVPYSAAARGIGAMFGIGPTANERLAPYVLRRWEILSEPTPNVGDNDTSLSLAMFDAIKIQ
ncbi:hypothetical protein CDD82_7384 [Ophiocordyceps australis]|uniref:Mediator of RNA polymerase II transcription subunit 12 n=1 Tax=Ophiocordyceps australis TaxID=1399860 RepID=A0A2C5XVW7_9HYPO|nr:hypothetical protein CDD82_7384 [Ophiocordyceps australis]